MTFAVRRNSPRRTFTMWMWAPARCLGSRVRLLHDDRRRGVCSEAPRSDLRGVIPRYGQRSAHAGARKTRRHRRAGLSSLWSKRSRPFRQDVHNGIEYGVMAAYVEGFGVLRSANVGKQGSGAADAE